MSNKVGNAENNLVQTGNTNLMVERLSRNRMRVKGRGVYYERAKFSMQPYFNPVEDVGMKMLLKNNSRDGSGGRNCTRRAIRIANCRAASQQTSTGTHGETERVPRILSENVPRTFAFDPC
jgi:hypothetical protein